MNRLVLEAIALITIAFFGAAVILVAGSRSAARPDGAATLAAPVAAQGTSQPAPGASRPDMSGAPSSETRAYLDWLTPKAQLTAESLRAIGTLTDQLAQNPLLLRDDGWKVRTAAAVEILRYTGQEIQAYPGPVPLAAMKLDGMNKEIGRDLVYIATEYSASVDQLSVARLKNVVERVNAIRPKAEAATAEAETLGRE